MVFTGRSTVNAAGAPKNEFAGFGVQVSAKPQT
jgi:hypothetical protein